VAALLKERGGVDFIYDQLSASKKICREVIAVEDEGDEPNAENLPDDETSDADEDTTDGTLASDSIVLNVNPPSDDRVSRLVPPLPRMQPGQHDEARQEVAANPYDKKGPMNRIDLETEVPFKFSPGEARKILQS
jgi:hypothetical protein